MYEGLEQEGFYLPAFNSSVITTQYLLNVVLLRCYRIPRKEILIAYIQKKASRIKIYDELVRVAAEKKIQLGFDSGHLPDKTWMTNILFKLEEKNNLFTKIIDTEGVIGLTREELNLIKELDTSGSRKKILKFFRRTPEQIKKQKNLSALKKLEGVKKRLQRKKQESDKIELQIRQCQLTLQQFQPSDDGQSIRKQQRL